MVLKDVEQETQAQKLIREYKIKLQAPEPNCGPLMVDICTQEQAFAQYKLRPNIEKLINANSNAILDNEQTKEMTRLIK